MNSNQIWFFNFQIYKIWDTRSQSMCASTVTLSNKELNVQNKVINSFKSKFSYQFMCIDELLADMYLTSIPYSFYTFAIHLCISTGIKQQRFKDIFIVLRDD